MTYALRSSLPLTAIGFALALAIALTLPAKAYFVVWGAVFLLLAAPAALMLQSRLRFHLLILLVVMSAAFPVQFGNGGNGDLNLALPFAFAIVAGWAFDLLLRPRQGRASFPRYGWAAVAFASAICVSQAFAFYPVFPAPPAPLRAQIGQTALFLASIGLLLACAYQIRRTRQLAVLVWAFLAAGVVVCVLQLSPALEPIARHTTAPESIGSSFWVWFMAIAASQALFNVDLKPGVRLLLAGFVGIAIFHCVVQRLSWVSGWGPPLTALAILAAARLPRVAIAGTFIAIPLALAGTQEAASKLFSGEAYSVMTRLEAWKVVLAMVRESPLIGLGPANYYHYAPLFPILGWHVRFSSHNNYIDVIAQFGIIGFLAFGWLCYELARALIRIARTSKAGFDRAYSLGAIAGFAAVLASGMLGDWLVPFVYNTGVDGFRSSLLTWIFVGGALALPRIARMGSVFDKDAR